MQPHVFTLDLWPCWDKWNTGVIDQLVVGALFPCSSTLSVIMQTDNIFGGILLDTRPQGDGRLPGMQIWTCPVHLTWHRQTSTPPRWRRRSLFSPFQQLWWHYCCCGLLQKKRCACSATAGLVVYEGTMMKNRSESYPLNAPTHPLWWIIIFIIQF